MPGKRIVRACNADFANMLMHVPDSAEEPTALGPLRVQVLSKEETRQQCNKKEQTNAV